MRELWMLYDRGGVRVVGNNIRRIKRTNWLDGLMNYWSGGYGEEDRIMEYGEEDRMTMGRTMVMGVWGCMVMVQLLRAIVILRENTASKRENE